MAKANLLETLIGYINEDLGLKETDKDFLRYQAWNEKPVTHQIYHQAPGDGAWPLYQGSFAQVEAFLRGALALQRGDFRQLTKREARIASYREKQTSESGSAEITTQVNDG